MVNSENTDPAEQLPLLAERGGCLGRLMPIFGWLWLLLLLVGGVGLVAVLLDVSAVVAVPGFWTLLLLLLFIAMGGMGILYLRMAKSPTPADPPEPPAGCLPGWIWIVAWVLSLAYLLAGIVWLLGDADSGGGWWTLAPIAIVLLVAGIGVWLWTALPQSVQRSSVGSSAPVDWLTFLGVFILLIGIVGVVLWFAGGRADIASTTVADDNGVVTTDSVAVPATEPAETVPPETSAAEVTIAPEVVETEPEEVEIADPPAPEPAATPLPEDVAVLLGRWCAAALNPPSGEPTVESVFTKPLDVVTRPADSTDPPQVADPPSALDIKNLGVSAAGCEAESKVIVIATLGGSPSEVQLSLALDVSDDPGHVADPDAPELIPQVGGWDEFLAYDTTNGLFHSDAEFVPIDTTAEADMEGNAFAFIIDRPADTDTIEATFQTFFRDGELASSPTAWQGATIKVSF